jgi:membrane protease subunit (stomatin/prohibitin family)
MIKCKITCLSWRKKKMGLLKVIEYTNASQDEILKKFELGNNYLTKGSKLTVREGQNVVFSDKGRMADVFLPGFYTLNTDNIPMLTKLMSWKYGFESPFKSDIFFVNTTTFLNQKWGTTSPIIVKDPEFGLVRVRGYGSYSFKVKDAYVFLTSLAGTQSSFKTSDVTNYLKSILVQGITDAIGEAKLTVYDMAANLNELSQKIQKGCQKIFEEVGLDLTRIIIESFNLPQEVEEAIDKSSAMGFRRKNVDVEIELGKLDALKSAASNTGSLGGAMGAGLGMSFGREIGRNIQSSGEDITQKNTNSGNVTCPKCHKSVPKGKFCAECGSALPAGKFCPDCGAKIGANDKFCPECGKKL